MMVMVVVVVLFPVVLCALVLLSCCVSNATCQWPNIVRRENTTVGYFGSNRHLSMLFSNCPLHHTCLALFDRCSWVDLCSSLPKTPTHPRHFSSCLSARLFSPVHWISPNSTICLSSHNCHIGCHCLFLDGLLEQQKKNTACFDSTLSQQHSEFFSYWRNEDLPCLCDDCLALWKLLSVLPLHPHGFIFQSIWHFPPNDLVISTPPPPPKSSFFSKIKTPNSSLIFASDISWLD